MLWLATTCTRWMLGFSEGTGCSSKSPFTIHFLSASLSHRVLLHQMSFSTNSTGKILWRHNRPDFHYLLHGTSRPQELRPRSRRPCCLRMKTLEDGIFKTLATWLSNLAKITAQHNSSRGIDSLLMGATRVFAITSVIWTIPSSSVILIYTTTEYATSEASQKPCSCNPLVLTVSYGKLGEKSFCET